jgi:hypothetical protein
VSYDLAIWEGDLPADEATFDALFDQYLSGDPHPPTARILAYAQALEARFPDPESEEAPWSTGSVVDCASGPVLYVPVVYSQANDVAEVAAQLAAEHGLVFFDPQTGGLPEDSPSRRRTARLPSPTVGSRSYRPHCETPRAT